MSKCICCGRDKELRYGCCFECAEAEAIIASGLDMQDNLLPREDRLTGYSTPLNKLKYLVKKGWTPPPGDIIESHEMKKK